MRSPPRRSTVVPHTAVPVLLVLALIVSLPVGRAAPAPPAPLSVGRDLLSNLSAPSVDPGGSTSIAFRLHDLASFFPLSNVVVGFEVYALNGYPGDAVGPVPVANAPVLAADGQSGASVNLSLGSVGLNGTVNGVVAVATSAATAAGTYAVRTSVSLVANGSDYLFESRGWFSAGVWANATSGPNGSATVNLSRLGVSGLVPETAVYVSPSSWPVVLGVLLAVGGVLLGTAAWLYFRRGPGSRSGAETDEPPGPTNAPRAFGSRRSSPGDSRSS